MRNQQNKKEETAWEREFTERFYSFDRYVIYGKPGTAHESLVSDLSSIKDFIRTNRQQLIDEVVEEANDPKYLVGAIKDKSGRIVETMHLKMITVDDIITLLQTIKIQNNTMKTITVDGIEYAPLTTTGDVKIVILQRGWVMVGRFERKGSDCKLINASVIRSWGTTKGLGEIAKDGPTSSTKLDPCNGVVEFDYLTVVATISCDEKAWKKQV